MSAINNVPVSYVSCTEHSHQINNRIQCTNCFKFRLKLNYLIALKMFEKTHGQY